ncbi:hypothetical protein BAUCODRAFT_189869 [Baudoinia panamericana UAMH 10762]|uniref:Uncharacterized protein n=1 Tax=Baudoinia panamericana (strain UAMH 10762) TaxID=717646 RepID=M2NNX1_BAUPA|nr:uncharacterized protein BAUCODRAFT_189869 [Baudoinia panamericana UAMH 10762]EMD00936.1 hypothetical protein BAUCODRAFT_189869 [Baudoinia panamericana UAMH 10762]
MYTGSMETESVMVKMGSGRDQIQRIAGSVHAASLSLEGRSRRCSRFGEGGGLSIVDGYVHAGLGLPIAGHVEVWNPPILMASDAARLQAFACRAMLFIRFQPCRFDCSLAGPGGMLVCNCTLLMSAITRGVCAAIATVTLVPFPAAQGEAANVLPAIPLATVYSRETNRRCCNEDVSNLIAVTKGRLSCE